MRLGEDPKLRCWHRTWVDEMNNLSWERDLKLKGEENEKTLMSNNKTLMQCAADCVYQNDKDVEALK